MHSAVVALLHGEVSPAERGPAVKGSVKGGNRGG